MLGPPAIRMKPVANVSSCFLPPLHSSSCSFQDAWCRDRATLVGVWARIVSPSVTMTRSALEAARLCPSSWTFPKRIALAHRFANKLGFVILRYPDLVPSARTSNRWQQTPAIHRYSPHILLSLFLAHDRINFPGPGPQLQIRLSVCSCPSSPLALRFCARCLPFVARLVSPCRAS